jgi:hypothetical protein
MSNHAPSTDISGSTSAAGALVSLTSFVVAFFSESHIWLQNLGLLVSVTAGTIGIMAFLYKFATWVQAFFKK